LPNATRHFKLSVDNNLIINTLSSQQEDNVILPTTNQPTLSLAAERYRYSVLRDHNLAGANSFLQFYMALPLRDAGTGVHVYYYVLSFMKHGFIALYHPASTPPVTHVLPVQ
jgi:hypothetical protein